MPTEIVKRGRKSNYESTTSKDARFLEKVLELLKTPVKKYKSDTSPKPHQMRFPASFEKEEELLRQFWTKYKSERVFSQLTDHIMFFEVFKEMVKERLCVTYWNENASPENILRLFQCLRILLRDQNIQDILHECNGLPHIAQNMEMYAEIHLRSFGDEIMTDILKEVTNICQKLSAEPNQRDIVIENGIHKLEENMDACKCSRLTIAKKKKNKIDK